MPLSGMTTTRITTEANRLRTPELIGKRSRASGARLEVSICCFCRDPTFALRQCRSNSLIIRKNLSEILKLGARNLRVHNEGQLHSFFGKAYFIMDTMTYASVAALPWSVAQNKKHPVVPEAEFTPVDLPCITR